jgi:hypothetical protein
VLGRSASGLKLPEEEGRERGPHLCGEMRNAGEEETGRGIRCPCDRTGNGSRRKEGDEDMGRVRLADGLALGEVAAEATGSL